MDTAAFLRVMNNHTSAGASSLTFTSFLGVCADVAAILGITPALFMAKVGSGKHYAHRRLLTRFRLQFIIPAADMVARHRAAEVNAELQALGDKLTIDFAPYIPLI